MKYWHELPQSEIDDLYKIGVNVEYVLKNYSQPIWCNYHEALSMTMGCWSLCDNKPNGLRTKISKKFCKDCECNINKS